MADLDAMIAKFRKLGKVAEDAARESAPLVEAALRRTAAAGTAPDGKAWAPKKDGTRALPDAPGAIHAASHGSVVQVRITGGYVLQNRLKGDARRQVIPDSGAPLPPVVIEALTEGARRAFHKATGT